MFEYPEFWLILWISIYALIVIWELHTLKILGRLTVGRFFTALWLAPFMVVAPALIKAGEFGEWLIRMEQKHL